MEVKVGRVKRRVRRRVINRQLKKKKRQGKQTGGEARGAMKKRVGIEGNAIAWFGTGSLLWLLVCFLFPLFFVVYPFSSYSLSLTF